MLIKRIFFVIFLLLLFTEAATASVNIVGNYQGGYLLKEKQYEFYEFPVIRNKNNTGYYEDTKVGHFTARSFSIPKAIDSVRIFHNYKKTLEDLGYTIELASSSSGTSNFNVGQAYLKMVRNLSSLAHFEGEADLNYSSPYFFLSAYKITETQKIWINFGLVTNTNKQRNDFRPVLVIVSEEKIPDDKVEVKKADFLTSSDIKDSLNESGKATLHNIYFDLNKAVLKKESEPAIAEIAKYLQANPESKLIVTGHTDNVGDFGYNIELSQKRSFAVLERLIKTYKIKAKRLLGFGAGMAAPMASNETEKGRALNRRVELVKWNTYNWSQNQKSSLK